MLRCAVGGATRSHGACIQNDSGRLQDAGASRARQWPQVTPRSRIINPTDFSRASRKLLAGVWTLALLLLGLALAASWPTDESAPQASLTKPMERQAASSMLAESGYAMAIAKDKLD
jgi:hypothetical protein